MNLKQLQKTLLNTTSGCQNKNNFILTFSSDKIHSESQRHLGAGNIVPSLYIKNLNVH